MAAPNPWTRRVVSAVARRLLTWANSVLAEGEPRPGIPEPVPSAAPYEPADGGPPAHWVEKVRRGAPWLLENAPRPTGRALSAPALSLVEPTAPERPPLEPAPRPWLPASRAAPPEPSAKIQARPPLRLAALPWQRPASKVQPPAPPAPPAKADRSAAPPPQPCGRFGISEVAEPPRETARPAASPELPDRPERAAEVPPTPEIAPQPNGGQVLFLVREGPGRASPQPRPSGPSPDEERRFPRTSDAARELEPPARAEVAPGQGSPRGNAGSARGAPAAVHPRDPESPRAPDVPARSQPSTSRAREMPAVPADLEAAAQVDPWPALPEAPEASPGPARVELREAERLRRLELEQRGA